MKMPDACKSAIFYAKSSALYFFVLNLILNIDLTIQSKQYFYIFHFHRQLKTSQISEQLSVIISKGQGLGSLTESQGQSIVSKYLKIKWESVDLTVLISNSKNIVLDELSARS